MEQSVQRFTAELARATEKKRHPADEIIYLFAAKVGIIIRDLAVRQFYSKVKQKAEEEGVFFAKVCIDAHYFLAAALQPENVLPFGVDFSTTIIPSIVNGQDKSERRKIFEQLQKPELFITHVKKTLQDDGYKNIQVSIYNDGDNIHNVEISGSWR